ncbi:MAG: DUF177 domain-containing protein [Rhizobiaceae bacterium]|nr:DUF177 domain-containing protein [Rhizobiaceae bacterium]
MTAHDVSSPVSFTAHVARLPKAGMPVVIDATEAQREELAAAHGLEAVSRFHAELLVAPWKRNGVRVEGRVVADIVQACVVTLEPIEAHIDEPVSAIFLPEASRLGREGFGDGGEIVLSVDGPDSPETFDGERIDIGALAEEFFGLAIDPYPRKPGADSPLSAQDGETELEKSEFARKLESVLRKPRESGSS